MLGDSEKQLRKAVAKAAVLLWYSRFSVTNLSVRTYLRKGKEKLVVTWNYMSLGGSEREGVLFVFCKCRASPNLPTARTMAARFRPPDAAKTHAVPPLAHTETHAALPYARGPALDPPAHPTAGSDAGGSRGQL